MSYIQVPPETQKRRHRRPRHLAGQDKLEERRAEATATEMDHVASAPQPQDTTMTTKPKRKRGDRKANQYLDKA